MKFSALHVSVGDRERDHQNTGSSDEVCLFFKTVMSVDAADFDQGSIDAIRIFPVVIRNRAIVTRMHEYGARA